MRCYQQISKVALEFSFVTFLNYFLIANKKIKQPCLPTVNKSDLKLKQFESDYRCATFHPPNWKLVFDNLWNLFCLDLWTRLVTHKWLPSCKLKLIGLGKSSSSANLLWDQERSRVACELGNEITDSGRSAVPSVWLRGCCFAFQGDPGGGSVRQVI